MEQKSSFPDEYTFQAAGPVWRGEEEHAEAAYRKAVMQKLEEILFSGDMYAVKIEKEYITRPEIFREPVFKEPVQEVRYRAIVRQVRVENYLIKNYIYPQEEKNNAKAPDNLGKAEREV